MSGSRLGFNDLLVEVERFLRTFSGDQTDLFLSIKRSGGEPGCVGVQLIATFSPEQETAARTFFDALYKRISRKEFTGVSFYSRFYMAGDGLSVPVLSISLQPSKLFRVELSLGLESFKELPIRFGRVAQKHEIYYKEALDWVKFGMEC